MKSSYHLGCITALLAALLLCQCDSPPEARLVHRLQWEPQPIIDEVNPFIGTGGHGHTFPGACSPFGMVQLSPDTRLEGWDGCSGYHYSDDVVYGFSHTHLSGTGVSDYGDLLLMPCTGPIRWNNGAERDGKNGYGSSFRKKYESTSPGYYAVFLDDYEIDVELTAGQRVGMHRYQLPDTDFHLIVDLEHRDPLLDYSLSQSGSREISGYRISRAWAPEQHFYFVIQFSADIAEYHPGPVRKMAKEGSPAQLKQSRGKETIAAIRFDPDQMDRELKIKVGVSAVSVDNARENLDLELQGFNFEGLHASTRGGWLRELEAIELHSDDSDKRSIFYSALYHTMIAPNLWSDANGAFRGMDGAMHRAGHDVYTVFSLWDTFRALHPLLVVLQPERSLDFLRTFQLHYQHSGRLPVWELAANETDCMIGYHSVPVIWDAYLKGLRDFDHHLLLQAMRASAEMDHFGLESYRRYGYVRAEDEPESVSKTLEYAYDDWCIAQYALALGDTATYLDYMHRSRNYRNLFDPESGFFRARMDGAWAGPFDPAEVNQHYTEANAWQYSLFVPHDIEGLMELIGGPEGLEAHLDALFSASSKTSGREQADITGLIGQYAHGNEPSHHMAYLYNHAGAAWKSQERIRQILESQYSSAADGLSGNEDCGQMSAWYVWSAMGLYPLLPGSDHYAIASPLFDSLSLHLGDGKHFRIVAENQGSDRPYIERALLNGEEWPFHSLPHKVLMAGGELRLHMSDLPNKDWGLLHEGLSSQSEAKAGFAPRPAVPFFESDGIAFGDSVQIALGCVDQDARIRYRIDDGEATDYEGPFLLRESSTVLAWSEWENGLRSQEAVNTWHKVDTSRKIQLESEYHNAYNAGGERALIDHLRGSNNYQTGRWQGYQGQDLKATVDLGELRHVEGLAMGFLQDVGSWIWFPKELQVEWSRDGKQWQRAEPVAAPLPPDQHGSRIHDYEVAIGDTARYFRLHALSYGPIPNWHPGAGEKGWIFADEIMIQ